MEQTVVSKLIKDKTIVHWQRFADDVLCICKKGAVNTVLNKINGWDAKLTFKVEHLVNNENNLALKNRTIKFRKLFKKGEDTFFTNFQLSISPYKYKVNNIFTQLHLTRDCCSDEEQFSEALEE